MDRLVQLSTQIPRLRATQTRLCVESLSKSDELFDLYEKAKNVEMELAGWSVNLPEDYAYSRIELQQKDIQNMYPREAHTYKSVPVACNWNQWRIHRLYVLSIILQCDAILSSSEVKLPNTSQLRNTARSLADDVCASVPYHLGYCRGVISEEETSFFPHPSGVPRGSKLGKNSAWLLIPPMSLLARMTFLPESQRLWCKAYADYYTTNANVLVC